MRNNRKLMSIFCILTFFALLLTACGSNEKGKTAGTGKAEGAQAKGKDWAKDNKINETESADELYEKAKKEGKVVVYAKGSKFKDVKTSFEAKYPGITVEPYKIDRLEIQEKLKREHDAGVHNADVVHTNIEPSLVEGGYIHPYKPADILEKFYDDYKDAEYPVHYLTVNPIIYNTEAFDKAPISNWWDLTDPEWKGKILLNDPVSDASYSELFVTIVQNADEMAEAYKEKYGKEIELKEKNAGYEFIARFIKNDPVLMSSGEDIIESIGQPGQKNPPIGFASSSKLRHVEQSDLPIEGIFDIKPRISVKSSSVLYIADQAPHPNAAKLLARWAMGEADGKAEGLEPFNLYGSWVPRTDVENPNKIPADALKTWDLDQAFYDKTFPEFRNFWIAKFN